MFLHATQHVASYYAHTCADRLVDRAALDGEQDTEVLIIGAGFSGLHTALRLALAAARAVSAAILGQPDELDLYGGLVNDRFPGGKYMAAPLEAIGKAWYRLRDSV